jgi:hypothetical protein
MKYHHTTRQQRRDHDRQVKQIIRRIGRGERPPSMAVLWPLCPYRTVLFTTPDPSRLPDTPPSVVAVCLGFAPEDFSHRMRADII